MPLDRKAIVGALTSKGFAVKQKARDHDFFFLQVDGLTQPVFTKVSRGKKYKSIGDQLLGRMSRQLKLTRSQFDELVDCPLTHKDYLQLLKQQGILP